MKLQFSIRWLIALTMLVGVIAAVLVARTPVHVVLTVEQDFWPGMQQVSPNEVIYVCTGKVDGSTPHVKCKLIFIFESNAVLVEVSRHDGSQLSNSAVYEFSYQDDGLLYWKFPHLDN